MPDNQHFSMVARLSFYRVRCARSLRWPGPLFSPRTLCSLTEVFGLCVRIGEYNEVNDIGEGTT